MASEILPNTTFLVTCASGREREAATEVRTGLRGTKVRHLFLKGNLILTCDDDPGVALAMLAERETAVVGHVIPLQVRCDIGPGWEALRAVAEASDLLTGPSPEGTFRVRCSRRGHHEWTSQDLELAVAERVSERTGANVNMREPEQLVRVEVFQGVAWLGAMWADDLLTKKITRMRVHAPGERPLNRAETKLREILARFEISLPADARALDIGASPGGWTKVLAEHATEVVAVDPGMLDPSVTALPNVRHLVMRSERLGELPDLGLFDIITDDMNMDPDKSAAVLCDLAPLLKPQGVAVLTVKFMTRRRRELVQSALDVLKRCYEPPRIGKVMHSARETTLVMRRKGSGEV